uniref:Secreted protein n=1 Tax=Anguilla anguilla TaxID=7936 RepID=A0A0E9WWA7_ANGAN
MHKVQSCVSKHIFILFLCLCSFQCHWSCFDKHCIFHFKCTLYLCFLSWIYQNTKGLKQATCGKKKNYVSQKPPATCSTCIHVCVLVVLSSRKAIIVLDMVPYSLNFQFYA